MTASPVQRLHPCPGCGVAVSDDSGFCPACGATQKAKASPPAQPAPAPARAPQARMRPATRMPSTAAYPNYRRPTIVPPQPEAITKIQQTLAKVNIEEAAKASSRVIGRGALTRPGFSGCWVIHDPPENGELLLEYPLGRSHVQVYHVPNEIDILYHLDLADYQISAQHVDLIQLTRDELFQWYPKQVRLTRLLQTRQYVQELSEKLMYRIAKERGISLGQTTATSMPRLKNLAEILTRHVAGLGVMEILLEDPHVQDIYVDAPASENRVHLRIAGYQDERIGDRCLTNIILTEQESEAILARLRIESGRPFSEAMPVMETDLREYNTRASVIGPPLSPDGLAIALRRHATEPWTLLKFLQKKMLSPFAAGLLSFLIDGHSTLLVTGSRGAGKTSMVGALMLEFPKSQRILTLEDTLELPTAEMRQLGYKVQTIFVRSGVGGQGAEMTVDDALRVSLRLGESAIVLGEVRGSEARTLYEAMRAGTAGSAVLGTIHGNSARSVFERVVHDIGIPPTSFNATDIVIVVGLTNPGGSVRTQLRRMTQIAELDKQSKDPGTFINLMQYDETKDQIVQGSLLSNNGKGDPHSQRIQLVADMWGLSYEEALQNIQLRAAYRELIVQYAEANDRPEMLSPSWVSASNTAFWEIMEKHKEEVQHHTLSYEAMLKEWKTWFEGALRYV